MAAIEILMGEHRLIERGIDALVAFAEEVGRGGGDKAELSRFVTFIREFADARHHGKEEEILFRAMVEAGFPAHSGPIGVMLMEHDRGRAHVRTLAALAAQAEPWSEGDRRRVGEEAAGFAGLLRAHIHKEDAILYPMAEQRLPPEVLEGVDRACEAYEARQDGGRLRALAAELVARHAPGLPGQLAAGLPAL
jgi:hemerythrin-like domain-containing protein